MCINENNITDMFLAQLSFTEIMFIGNFTRSFQFITIAVNMMLSITRLQLVEVFTNAHFSLCWQELT